MVLLDDLPPVGLHPRRLFWTVFGEPRHEPARGMVCGLFAAVVIRAEQDAIFYSVSGSVVIAVDDMVGL